jgi:hypothetical protein
MSQSSQVNFRAETIDDYQQEVEKIEKNYSNKIRELKSERLANSLIWNLIILLMGMVSVLFVANKFTNVDPMSLLDFRRQSISKTQNRKAFIKSQIILGAFYLISFLFFVIFTFGFQHLSTWSNSIVASPEYFLNYFIILLIPIGLSCLYIRLPFLLNAKWKSLGIFECCVRRSPPQKRRLVKI